MYLVQNFKLDNHYNNLGNKKKLKIMISKFNILTNHLVSVM